MWKSEKGNLEAKCLLACLPDIDKEIFCMSLLKTILSFLTNQVTWFCSCGIIFSREFHGAIHLMDLSKIFDKTLRPYYEGVDMIQFL